VVARNPLRIQKDQFFRAIFDRDFLVHAGYAMYIVSEVYHQLTGPTYGLSAGAAMGSGIGSGCGCCGDVR
jgi:hypothetical protein